MDTTQQITDLIDRDSLADILCRTNWIADWYERADAVLDALAASR